MPEKPEQQAKKQKAKRLYCSLNGSEERKEKSMSEYILETNQLTKQYKNQTAVKQVNLHLEKGSIYGFIGRNGAGKTTFLKLISGLAAPTSGEITLFGRKKDDAKEVLDRIGVLIEAPGLYPGMTAMDNLKLKALCLGNYQNSELEEILQLVGLSEAGKKKVKHFSLGMKQRLGIGMALVGNPDLLVLDEPINGLDPQGILEVRETIRRLNQEQNITVILSSHILEELSKLVTHYGIIHRGELLEEMTREELQERCGERIEIITTQAERACTTLERLGIQNYKVIDQTTLYVQEHLERAAEINRELLTDNVLVESFGVKRASLESYFIELTGESPVSGEPNTRGGEKRC